MLEIIIKRYLKITHIFSSAMWCLPREIFNLVIKMQFWMQVILMYIQFHDTEWLFPGFYLNEDKFTKNKKASGPFVVEGNLFPSSSMLV